MSLMPSVPEEIAHAAEALAQRSGETPDCILLNALWANFPRVTEDLKKGLTDGYPYSAHPAWRLAS